MVLILSIVFSGLYISVLGRSLLDRDITRESSEELNTADVYITFPFTYLYFQYILPTWEGLRLALDSDYRNQCKVFEMEAMEGVERAIEEAKKRLTEVEGGKDEQE